MAFLIFLPKSPNDKYKKRMTLTKFNSSNRFIFKELVLFAAIWLFIVTFGNGLVLPLITKIMGIENLPAFLGQLSEYSSPEYRLLGKLVMILNQLFTFFIPSLIFLLWIHQRKAVSFLSLNRFPNVNVFLAGSLLIVAAFPLAQFLLTLNQQIPLPGSAIDLEKQAEGLTKALVVMDYPSEFLLSLVTIAVVPAICEELFFRGILQNYLTKASGEKGIWLTAFVFSAIHMQWEGFLPRFFLGLVLGYLFYWSKSLWLPIIAHFITNGMQVVAVYFYKKTTDVNLEEIGDFPIMVTIIAFFVAIFLGYYIYNQQKLEGEKPVY